MIEWLKEHETVLTLLGLFSAGSMVLALFLTPWALSMISADHFVSDQRKGSRSGRSFGRWLILGLRNLLGVTFVFVGVVLLALPGQGVLTIFAGVIIMSFPGKRSLELWLVRLPFVLKSVNWIRSRRGRGPLRLPGLPASPTNIE